MKFLRNIFFPAHDVPLRRQLTPFVTLGIIFLAVMLISPMAWDYTNSSEFCGTSCHTMPPAYSTYLASPHARVSCVDCHIGRDWLIVQAYRKVGHVGMVTAQLFQEYEYPVRAGELSPARDTCEHCHSPEKFSDDSLRMLNRFENDRENSPFDLYLLMHTGGGSQREGLGRGIHWHIEANITYIALDEEKQEIPWVRVESPDGEITDYNAINSPVDTANLDQYEMLEMDCATCHNRVSHLISSPDRDVDLALSKGDISRDIPFIRVNAVDILSADFASAEDADETFLWLDQYYSENYSEFYESEGGQEKVQQAIESLSEMYRANNFPAQQLDWSTHPNNLGHLTAPGCFRCHDGQHFSPVGEVVRLECNLCHSIPIVVDPDDIEPSIPLSTGTEPNSHLDSTWISRHHNEFDVTCSNCHSTNDPGGTSNSSFCSNSACHGTEWTYAGFNAPGLATILGIYQVEAEPLLKDFDGEPTYEILQPLFAQECAACHGTSPSKGLRLTDLEGLLNGSEGGAIVISGAPDESLMIEVLTEGHFARLTDHQMDLLTQWIANGLPE
jgi:nitrate/TMAO reductase-like tetraheme cytochrome c subunit